MPSIILFRLDDERSEIVNQRLGEVLAHFKEELDRGAVVSVNQMTIRVRELPV